MKNQKRQAGFTLIELMIVMAIIGILMAYAIPAYRDYTTRSKAGECLAVMNGAKLSVSERWSATNNLASLSSNAAAFLAAAGSITGANVDSVTVSGSGVITCAFGVTASGNVADPDLAGKTIILTPTDDVGSLTWDCTTAGGMLAAHKPGGCI